MCISVILVDKPYSKLESKRNVITEQQRINQKYTINSVERLESALKQLGFALERREKQIETQRKTAEAHVKALSERIDTLETHLQSLLKNSFKKEEE